MTEPLVIGKPTTPDHVKQILALARRMHAEGVYAFLPFDTKKVGAGILACASLPDHFAALALRGPAVVGFFGGKLAEYPFCAEKLAHDVGFYVAPEARASSAAVRLVRAFEAWAAEKGAREVSLGVSSGVDVARIDLFYRRLGFANTGGNYRRRL